MTHVQPSAAQPAHRPHNRRALRPRQRRRHDSLRRQVELRDQRRHHRSDPVRGGHRAAAPQPQRRGVRARARGPGRRRDRRRVLRPRRRRRHLGARGRAAPLPQPRDSGSCASTGSTAAATSPAPSRRPGRPSSTFSESDRGGPSTPLMTITTVNPANGRDMRRTKYTLTRSSTPCSTLLTRRPLGWGAGLARRATACVVRQLADLLRADSEASRSPRHRARWASPSQRPAARSTSRP